ncbi:hypothetical protein BJY04DRAFT_225734 [Aspergillus karnatakaensis]|uniref:uncharacterized protein n=1 Tax=Aspergillus karnatakaensis TaxID=1810916 RepID=UPI003CCD99D0
MDGSLQVDRHEGLRSPNYSYRREASSNSEVSDRFEHYAKQSPGTRPMSLGAGSSVRPSANGEPVDARERPPTPLDPQDKSRDSHEGTLQTPNGGIESLPQMPTGYSRPLINQPIVNNQAPKLDDLGRRRSKTIGFSPRDSRIAALSVQLRTRLSHAAARIEKKRQSQMTQFQPPASFLQNNISTPTLSTEALPRLGQSFSAFEIQEQRSIANGSPSGTTVSAPDASASPHIPELFMRPSPVNIARGLYPPPQPDPQKHMGASSRESTPGLAPPADIIPSRTNGQRRRPNPNLLVNSPRHNPFSLHRRSRSQNELQRGSDVTLVPETPPLRPSNLNSITSHNGLTESSQSSLMEQDAIETLLFMSSPGTSGYHSNSQNSLNDQDIMNIDRSASQSVQWQVRPGDSQSSQLQQTGNSDAQAGDEIDKMLDQMNSDSDDDTNNTSKRSSAA